MLLIRSTLAQFTALDCELDLARLPKLVCLTLRLAASFPESVATPALYGIVRDVDIADCVGQML